MKIKGLLESLGLSQEQEDALRLLRMQAATQRVMFYMAIISNGGKIHRYPGRKEMLKRRAKNKAARKARRANR